MIYIFLTLLVLYLIPIIAVVVLVGFDRAKGKVSVCSVLHLALTHAIWPWMLLLYFAETLVDKIKE
jgi:hypothetical protein